VALTIAPFLGLLGTVALVRGAEVLISRRHQSILAASGARQVDDPDFCWMVGLHAGVIVCAAMEVLVLKRPFIPPLAVPAAIIFAVANVVRWWVIRTLGDHWNVRVMDSIGMGVIDAGPFRWVRHPNYTAVFFELAALPLIHTAWITALTGSAAHVWVLSRRLAIEESVLHRHANYCALMGHKPRFLPKVFHRRLRHAPNVGIRSDSPG
jgi:methyltransferase